MKLSTFLVSIVTGNSGLEETIRHFKKKSNVREREYIGKLCQLYNPSELKMSCLLSSSYSMSSQYPWSSQNLKIVQFDFCVTEGGNT